MISNVKTPGYVDTSSRLGPDPGSTTPTPVKRGPRGGEGDVVYGGATIVKGSILAVDGVLYVTAPDSVGARCQRWCL